MGKSSVSDLSEHVFDLIQELFAIDPMLLTSVMPQLEFKLKVNTTQSPHPNHNKPSQLRFSVRYLNLKMNITLTNAILNDPLLL